MSITACVGSEHSEQKRDAVLPLSHQLIHQGTAACVDLSQGACLPRVGELMRLRLMDFVRRLVGPVPSLALRRLSDEDYAAYLNSIGIRAETGDREWRCCECSRMQHVGLLGVWIPDGTCKGDPLWAVLAKCRRWKFNGDFSAWCLSCCRSFKPMSAEEMMRYGNTPHDPIPTITLIVK